DPETPTRPRGDTPDERRHHRHRRSRPHCRSTCRGGPLRAPPLAAPLRERRDPRVRHPLPLYLTGSDDLESRSFPHRIFGSPCSMIDGVEVRPVDLVARPETSSIRGIELGGNAEQTLEPRLLVCCQLAAPGLETLEELRDGNHVPAVGGDEPCAPRARGTHHDPRARHRLRSRCPTRAGTHRWEISTERASRLRPSLASRASVVAIAARTVRALVACREVRGLLASRTSASSSRSSVATTSGE